MNSRLLSRALLHALACTSFAAASAASAHDDPRLETLHKEVIAKHDENYEPPEVTDALAKAKARTAVAE